MTPLGLHQVQGARACVFRLLLTLAVLSRLLCRGLEGAQDALAGRAPQHDGRLQHVAEHGCSADLGEDLGQGQARPGLTQALCEASAAGKQE